MEPADLLQLLSDQQARRLRVIENLLRGRRTVSTLYWGLRYDLLYLLDLNKHLPRGGLDAVAHTVVANGWAQWGSDEQPQLRLTSAGVHARDQRPYYQPGDVTAWPLLDLNVARQRLLLAIQVTSEYAHQTNRYYPLAVDQATRQTVRRWFYQVRDPALPAQVAAALTATLATLPPTVAAVTTAGLTGYQQPGQTTQQLADQFAITSWEAYLMHVTAVVAVAQAARDPHHVLAPLLAPTWQSPVTRSAQATLATVMTGTPLDRVAAERHIKPSTVREHLLEAAIMLPPTALPYDRLIPAAARQALLTALPQAIDEWEYTALPAELQERYDFFTFRLLAIWQHKRGVD